MKCYQFILGCVVCLLLVGCRHKQVNKPLDSKENEEAKALLQGIWVDEESDDVSFKAKGDTIYYPDTTSVPVYFRIVNDTLVLHGAEVAKYPIVKQTAHVFLFKNQNGDLLKLTKSDDPNDESLFENRHPKPVSVDHVVKRDTVVMHGDERYHCYVYINPTRYKVNKVSYNDDGVEVDNVYYDNIIHISVFHGVEQLYSRDFNKQMFKGMIPDRFLVQSILSNMEFDSVDNSGFHFNATICIPDGASCYMVGVTISFKGQMKMELMDY